MCLNPVCVLTFIEMKKMKENKKKKPKEWRLKTIEPILSKYLMVYVICMYWLL